MFSFRNELLRTKTTLNEPYTFQKRVQKWICGDEDDKVAYLPTRETIVEKRWRYDQCVTPVG